ncbi:MAG: glyoxylate/hydroxypyruvate reductase A [Proteobacteria bacterium]|nr:glyoxylate/hydroxypyruvate reductase A [Pseudomonadota bacterium]MDA1152161.1 glyoxylate/hydroxypyruvate reductase A [Pseudomonadota bacterium]
MTVIGFYGSSKMDGWRTKLGRHLDDFTLVDLMSPEGERADIALVWAPPKGQLAKMPNLRGIIMQGQGVDYMMSDPTVPRDVPLVRLVDPDMSNALSHWAILAALDFWRDGAYYRDCQAAAKWAPVVQRPATGAKVGIMGVGAIGSVMARRFASLGFDVRGWARSVRQVDHVEIFAGEENLPAFLDGLNILISVLPLTPATTGIMNSQLFNQLAKGAYIINGGRGPQLVDADLLEAIASGQIAGAALDVFATEPLPTNHAFWAHPKITVWPHVAAQTNPNTAAMQVAAAIRAIMAGNEPDNRVDWSRGY